MRKQLGDIGGGVTDYESAREHYSAALKQNASLNEVRLEYIDVLLKLGEVDKAGGELARVKSAGHLKSAVLFCMGEFFRKNPSLWRRLNHFKWRWISTKIIRNSWSTWLRQHSRVHSTRKQ